MNRAISHNIRDAAEIIIKAPYLFNEINFIHPFMQLVYVNTHVVRIKAEE